MELDGKIVLVTGSSSGIGQAIALACARAGADVAVTYRANSDGAEGTAREIRALGRRAEVFQLDVSREAEIGALATALRERFGRVDSWINNAGADILTGAGGRLSRLEKLDRVLAVDLRGTILASWAAVEMSLAPRDSSLQRSVRAWPPPRPVTCSRSGRWPGSH